MKDFPNEAYYQLQCHQRQLDPDGCEVGVSRQALEEILDFLKEPKPETAASEPTREEWFLLPSRSSQGWPHVQLGSSGGFVVRSAYGVERALADAKLLVAAPKLLSALEGIQARLRGDFAHPELVKLGPLITTDADIGQIVENTLLEIQS